MNFIRMFVIYVLSLFPMRMYFNIGEQYTRPFFDAFISALVDLFIVGFAGFLILRIMIAISDPLFSTKPTLIKEDDNDESENSRDFD